MQKATKNTAKEMCEKLKNGLTKKDKTTKGNDKKY